MIEQEIISDVADIYGITVDNILSHRRLRRYVDARSVICYLLCAVRGITTTEVGDMLNRTHASVIHLRKNGENWQRCPMLNKRGACAINELKKRYGSN